jgi:hypothetical protein
LSERTERTSNWATSITSSSGRAWPAVGVQGEGLVDAFLVDPLAGALL